jgi:hypothetical protein
MADCLAAVIARDLAAPLATNDPELLEICRSEDIDLAVLPDSNGMRWAPPS